MRAGVACKFTVHFSTSFSTTRTCRGRVSLGSVISSFSVLRRPRDVTGTHRSLQGIQNRHGLTLRTDEPFAALQISRQHFAGGFETKAYFDVCSGGRLDGKRAAVTPKPVFSFLIVFLLFRLTALGLATRALLSLLHWLVRLVARVLLRTGPLLIGMLQFAILLILSCLLL
jgi:hypothetical protein